MCERERCVLFIQATDAALYPPLLHAARLMADAGWQVTFLSAPIADNSIKLPSHPNIVVRKIRARPSHVMDKLSYAKYCFSTLCHALVLRPSVVYASDPMGAGPGLVAARLARAKLVYHEHDSPERGALRSSLAGLRKKAARAAYLVVFPNEERARLAQKELGFDAAHLRIVWNLPERSELPELHTRHDEPLVLYYHGSVTPERLPEATVQAIQSFAGRILLRIAGYEAPGAKGYVDRLVKLCRQKDGRSLVEYVGELATREALLAEASRAHVGLALLPMESNDVNLRNMMGASNKPFDYMAAGLALLVSDLSDWRSMGGAKGFARSCDPGDTSSVRFALQWFLDHPDKRRAMASRARAKIAAEWNYDTAFAPILRDLAYCA